MVKLLAMDPADGWAFVEQDESIILLRPPYKSWNMPQVKEQDVERAVLKHGFIAKDREFDDLAALLKYVSNEFREDKKRKGQEDIDYEKVRKQLLISMQDRLSQVLDRIENELMPNQEYEPARDLLTDMLMLDKVMEDTSLRERISSLLSQCRKSITKKEKDEKNVIDDKAVVQMKYPRAASKHSADALLQKTEAIRKRAGFFRTDQEAA